MTQRASGPTVVSVPAGEDLVSVMERLKSRVKRLRFSEPAVYVYNPLDASAVHPERYSLVERIAKDAGVATSALVGNEDLVRKISWASYASNDVGLPTLEDIRRELTKPGRDPRDTFEPPKFRDDIRTLEDLKPGMVLDGVVTNVTAFGAFVDLGVKQDGLVHISELADRFVKDPHEVARVGDRVKVRVLGVDLARKRVSLSRRSVQ